MQDRPMLKSENGQLATYVYVDTAGRDLGFGSRRLQRAWRTSGVAAGTTVAWSGQFEYLPARGND
jgi:Cu(I)/Ag(I) efflux system membrane protein CusA/SilA